MTRDELMVLHKELNDLGVEIMRAKNHDYAGDDGETPFANFEACEKLGICSTETGMLVRMCDKFMRLINLVKCGKLAVKGESRTDTVVDHRNYLLLFEALCQSKEKKDGRNDDPPGRR